MLYIFKNPNPLFLLKKSFPERAGTLYLTVSDRPRFVYCRKVGITYNKIPYHFLYLKIT